MQILIKKKEKPSTLIQIAGIAAFFIIVLAVGLMIYIIGLFPENSGFFVVMLGYLGGPVIAVIVFGLFMGFLTLLEKIGIYQYLASLAKNTFPFFIICVLVFWSGVAIYFMQNDFGNAAGKISKGGIIFSIIVSGLLPFRILMMFNAPLRFTNILFGTISIAYFIYQMVGLAY